MKKYWIVVGVTIVAAVFRFYRLSDLPPQAWVDEIWYNLRARDLVRSGDFHVFYPTFWGGMAPALVDLSAILHAVGHGSSVASRLIAAAAGTMTVPLAYLAASELLRRTPLSHARDLVASLTAIVTASLFCLVIASRIGTEPALIPPLALMYFWGMQVARRKDRWMGWLLAGVPIGAAQYVNLNGRFLIVLAMAVGGHDLVCTPPERRRSLFRGLCLATGAAAVVALPLIVFFVHEPRWIFARVPNITHGLEHDPIQFLAANTARTIGSIVVAGDLNPRHNLPGRPMLDWLQATGFVVGIAWSLGHVRRAPGVRVLLVWLAVMLLPSLTTDDAPHFERLIGLGFPIAVLVAIGWSMLWRRVRDLAVGGGWRALSAAALGLSWVTLSCGLTAHALLVSYPNSPGLSAAMTTYPVELARSFLARSATETVFVERLHDRDDVYAFDFMLNDSDVRRLDFRDCLPIADARTTRTTYLVYPDRDPDSVRRLADAYPDAVVREVRPDPATLMDRAVLFEIAAGASAPRFRSGGRARFENGLTLVGHDAPSAAVRAGETLTFATYWKVTDASGSKGLAAIAHLDGTEASSAPVAMSESAPCRGAYPATDWRPGDIIPTDVALRVPLDTLPGEYPIALGWQERPSLRRLKVIDADRPLPDERAVVAVVTIVPPTKSAIAPHD